jgi:hypothetical protein
MTGTGFALLFGIPVIVCLVAVIAFALAIGFEGMVNGDD